MFYKIADPNTCAPTPSDSSKNNTTKIRAQQILYPRNFVWIFCFFPSQKCATRTAIVFRLFCILLFFVSSFFIQNVFLRRQSVRIRRLGAANARRHRSRVGPQPESDFAVNIVADHLCSPWVPRVRFSPQTFCCLHAVFLDYFFFGIACGTTFKGFRSGILLEPWKSPGGGDGRGVLSPPCQTNNSSPAWEVFTSRSRHFWRKSGRGGGSCAVWSTEVFRAFQIIISSSYLRGLEIYFPATSCPVNLWGFQSVF